MGSLLRHVRRFCASLVMFGTSILVMLYIPARLIRTTMPSFLPYTTQTGRQSSGGCHALNGANPPPVWTPFGAGGVDPSSSTSASVAHILRVAGLGSWGHVRQDYRGPHLHGPGLVAEGGHRAALPGWD